VHINENENNRKNSNRIHNNNMLNVTDNSTKNIDHWVSCCWKTRESSWVLETAGSRDCFYSNGADTFRW
jgi:hypothetical protein